MNGCALFRGLGSFKKRDVTSLDTHFVFCVALTESRLERMS